MNENNMKYKEEYIKYQQKTTLLLGKIILFIGLPSILYFVLQDIFIIKIQKLFYFRLIFIIPFIIYILALVTVLKIKHKLIIYFHSFFLLSLNLSILAIINYFFSKEIINTTNISAFINAYSICVFIIFIISGISRKLFIPIVAIPFLTVLFLILFGKQNIDLHLLSEFSNPILLIVFLSVFSIFVENNSYNEFFMKEELKRVNFENEELNKKLIQELEFVKNAKQLLIESEEKYRILFENAVEAIIVAQDSIIKICNSMTEKLTGYSISELTAIPFNNFIHPDDRQFVLNNHLESINNGYVYKRYDFKILTKENDIKWVEINSIKIDWEGKPATLSFLTDITERKIAENALIESEAKYRFLTEYAGDVIWILNLSSNRFTYMSPAIYFLTGFTDEEAVNRSLEVTVAPEFLDVVMKDIPNYTKDFLENTNEPKIYTYELKLNCKNGKTIWCEISAKFKYNSSNELEIIGVTRDIEKRKKSEEEVIYLSYHDQLTGLYNRRYFETNIQMFNNEEYFPLTLAMIDVNGLKLTNDAFGHKMGDLLLESIANILKKECRQEDIISRIGGDEFVILLPKTDEQGAKKIIRRINNAVENEKIDNIVLSISVGFAVKEDESENINEIFSKAEDNMYRHKLSESTSMRSKTIDLIMHSLYEKSTRELLHSKRVSEICEAIAIKMNYEKSDINNLRVAGLMHDIGKIVIDEKIINKPEQLDNSEWDEIKKHPEVSYRILSSVNEFSKIADCVLEHHERWDGKGYPKGIKGEEILIDARIITIADAFASMTTNRPYTNALSTEEALEEIRRCAGLQFDPCISKIFVEQVCGKAW